LIAPRARGFALAGSAVVLLSGFGWQLGAISRAGWRSVLQPGPADLDQALAAIAGSLALILLAWLLLAVLLSVLAAVSSGTTTLGPSVANLARLVAPMILRNAVAAVLGVAIAAAPAAASPVQSVRSPVTSGSSAASVQAGRSPSVIQSPSVIRSPSVAAGLSPSWLPLRDHALAAASTAARRPTPTAPATPTGPPTPTASSNPTASLASAAPEVQADPELRPGWIPTRPPASDRPTRSSAAGGATTDLAPVATSAAGGRIEPDEQIVVRRGDTLWDIAARHLGAGATDGEIALEWPHWFTANRAVIGANPDQLVPGERLNAPESQAAERPSAMSARPRAGGGVAR
jgi:nucleoid-associated protein YgaU